MNNLSLPRILLSAYVINRPFKKKKTDANYYQSHQIPFTKRVYIDRSDFREEDSPDYFRMAPGKLVGLLKAPYPVVATSYEKDPETGLVNLIHARFEKPADGAAPKKPKA